MVWQFLLLLPTSSCFLISNYRIVREVKRLKFKRSRKSVSFIRNVHIERKRKREREREGGRESRVGGLKEKKMNKNGARWRGFHQEMLFAIKDSQQRGLILPSRRVSLEDHVSILSNRFLNEVCQRELLLYRMSRKRRPKPVTFF